MNREDLLNPIAPETPTGIYLKENRAQYRGVRNAFNAAQSSFRRLLETPDAMQDDERLKENSQQWQTLNTLCEDILTTQSKDIEVACWWISAAMFEQDAFVALSDRLQGFNQMLDAFWPDIHPYTPDEKLKEDDEAARTKARVNLQLRPLIQLVGESDSSGLLYMPFQLSPLIGDISLGDYISAQKKGSVSDLKTQASDQFSKEEDSITQKILNLGKIDENIHLLDTFVTSQCNTHGCDRISCLFLRKLVTETLGAIRFLVGDLFTRWPLEQVEMEENADNGLESNIATEEDGQVIPSKGGVPMNPGQINTRGEALKQLRLISEYFRTNEPHSPLSFMIEKTIRWGNLSFPELITELVKDDHRVMHRVEQLIDMKERESKVEDIDEELEEKDEDESTENENTDDESTSSSSSGW